MYDEEQDRRAMEIAQNTTTTTEHHQETPAQENSNPFDEEDEIEDVDVGSEVTKV